MPDLVRVNARPHIGRLDVVRMDMEAGRSLMDYAAALAPQMPVGFLTAGVAMIDDSDPIPPEAWSRIKPKPGHCVSFAIVPQGGKVVQTVAQIALVAAQAFLYVIPGIGPALSAALGLGGSLLLGAFSDQQQQGSGGKKQPKQLGEAGFSDNVLSPYNQIPTVVGTRRVPARYIAPPYVLRDEENESGVAIIGLAGRHEIRDPKVDGGPLDALDTFTREGDASDKDPRLYNSIVWQEPHRALSTVNMELDTDTSQQWKFSHQNKDDIIKYDLPKWHYFRLSNGKMPSRLILDFTLDQGLGCNIAGYGAIPIQMKFIKDGRNDVWLPFVVLRQDNQQGTPLRVQLFIEFSRNPGGWPANLTSNPWRQAYANSALQQLSSSESVAHSFYGTSAVASNFVTTAPNKATIYAPPNTLGIDGTWRLGIRRGCGLAAHSARFDWSSAKYAYNGGSFETLDFWYYRLASGVYRTAEDQATMNGNILTLSYVTRVYDTAAVDATGIATFEVQTQNQRVDQLSVLASRYVDKAWNGTAWVDQPHVSSNPAEIAYDICTNPLPTLLQRPLPSTLIDAAEFGAWADFCTAQGYECNAYLTDLTFEQALQIVFQAGHAYLRRSQTWGVVIEKSRASESPVHVFSPRNSRRFTITKTFEHKPHALRVAFDDEEDDFQTRPDMVVYAPGYNESNAKLFESVSYAGITREWQAIRRAQRDLAIRYYRNKVYSIETDTRYLVCERGSLVGINHFVLNQAHGFAAIREVKRQDIGGVTKITGLVLDTEIDMRPTTTGVAISTDNGVVTVATVSSEGASRLREIVFAASLTDDPNIREGCTVTTGEVGSEYIRAIVDDIQAGPDFTAQLTLYDEAPEIFTAYGY